MTAPPRASGKPNSTVSIYSIPLAIMLRATKYRVSVPMKRRKFRFDRVCCRDIRRGIEIGTDTQYFFSLMVMLGMSMPMAPINVNVPMDNCMAELLVFRCSTDS